MADYQQGYPGHCDPPSSLITYAILFISVAIVFGIIGLFVFRAVMLPIGFLFIYGALLSLSGIPEARRVCERSGGGICPACGHENPVKWNS
jgi:asparagine N-glycosylation enzyme membrane subunit Stt3